MTWQANIAEIVEVAWWLVVAGLAGSQAADTWTSASIFRRCQDWLKSRKERSQGLQWFLAELMTCPYCLSHWTAAICLGLGFSGAWWARVPVLWLAAVRIATLTARQPDLLLDETGAVDRIEVMDE